MATRRIAINCGAGYVPGLNCVITGATLAARELGWELVGLHDGYDGLLAPELYPDGGVVRFDARAIETLDPAANALGSGARNDPFRMRHVDDQGMIGEIDRSDDLLAALRAEGISAVVSIVGGSALSGQHALSVAFKLARKGLPTVCIPKSIENDIAATALSFGFNSTLSYVTETLDRIRAAARDVRRVAVVETPGHEAGWLALQSGIAARADVVLIPEIPYDLRIVADRLRQCAQAGGRPSLLVVAEGARARDGASPARDAAENAMRKSLSPLADPQYGEGARVIERSGALAGSIALELRRLADIETMPLALGQLVRVGAPTAVDRQLGLGYGAAAVRALDEGHASTMVSFQPPDIAFTPLGQAINKVRTVPAGSEFVRIARTLGVCLGD